MAIIGYVNGLPIEERSGTAHDPHTGQFTSGGSGAATDKAYAATLINAESRHKDSIKKGKSEHRDPEKKGWYSTPETGAAFNKSAHAYKHTTTASSKEEHAAAAKAHGEAIDAHTKLANSKNSRHSKKHEREASDHARLKAYHEHHSK